jgi:hypothetical protein
MSRSLHALAQECSRAIASRAAPQDAFARVTEIVVERTHAIEAIISVPPAVSMPEVGWRAFAQRRLCIEPAGENISVAAPIKNASKVFGLLLVTHSASGERFIGGHALSEVVNAVAQVLGNALALYEKVRADPSEILSRCAYDHYLRAHFELYRSFGVPFSVATYDLREAPCETRLSAMSSVRNAARRSDALFDAGEGIYTLLLANCPPAISNVAIQRITAGTGIAAQMVVGPRRSETLRHLHTATLTLALSS